MDISHPKNVINIPMPQQTQYVYRGFRDLQRKSAQEMRPISTRWSDEDRRFIDKQAARIGITFSEFVRWVAFFAAIEISKKHRIKSFNLSPDRVLPDQTTKPDYSDYE